MKWLIVLLVFLVNPENVFAASAPLSLETAIDEALHHSTKIQSVQAQANEAKWKHVEAFGGLLPQLSIQANHYFDIKYQFLTLNLGGPTATQFPLVFPETQATFDARWAIFDGFQNIYTLEAASRARDASDLQADWTRFQVSQELRLKFYQALAAQKLALVAEQNVKTLEDHLNKVKVRKVGGAATRYDVLRVEVQLDEARSEKMSSDDTAAVAKARLNEAMGIPDDDRALLGELPIPQPRVIERASPNDISARKDISALVLQSEAADKRQAAASSFWIPRVTLDYQYSYYNNVDYSLSTPFLDSHAFGLFLNWNIFDGAVSIARHQEAAQQTIQSETANRSAILKFKTDFEFWKRRYLYSTTLYHAKLADVDKAQESVRLATEAYRAGSQTSSEILDAELDLFRARAGAVNAQVNAMEALVNLEMATGRKF